MPADPRATLKRVLDPRSIAIIGASDNPHKIGGRPISYLGRYGYRGRVIPINPERAEVQGRRSYRSLADAPEVPEVAIIAVPGELAVRAVDECAAAGVSVCIIMASGFGEVHEEGKRQEAAMRARARAVGMRLIGPNSQGLGNVATGTIASFSTMFNEVEPLDGPIGVISQSGAMAGIPYGLLRQRGLGVRHSHATGNDCDVTVCEMACVVAEDPALKLLLLYLEGIPDPWNLAEAAAIGRERGMPIVVVKSGRTPAGQVAAMSHTGSLANEDRTVDAFLEAHGIMRVPTIADLVANAPLYLRGWRPRGRKLVAISNSGAVCVLAADAATDAAMPLEPLQESTQQELRGILPGFATVRNPVDITAALLSNSRLFGAILPAIARDPAADAFLIGIAVAGVGYDVDAFARDAAAFATATGKPLAVSAPQESIAAVFRSQGQVTFPTEAEAVRALGQYLTHAQRIADATERKPAIPAVPAPPSPERMLDEAQSLALVHAHGVPVVAHALCTSADEVRAAFARSAAGRVVVKGCTADASHKTELGLVRLGITDADAACAAYHAIEQSARAAGVRLSGVLVAEHAAGVRELMIGARIDPVFGPVVLVGDGGKFVEAMPDLRVLMAPTSGDRVMDALRSLRIAPLLDGFRGDPALDVAAFCDAAVAVGRLIADRASGVTQVDVNPVIVRARGAGCVAVDAVVYREANKC